MESEQKETLAQRVFARLKNDSAFRAALKRADNSATEYQCWEYLADYGVHLDRNWERLPYTLVLAAIARSGRESDGSLGLGEALCAAYEWNRESDPARSKLRRILACSDVPELCSVLRPVLQFITGKNVAVSYQSLLDDLRYFGDGERVKSKWAQQFYGTSADAENAGEENA